MTPDMVMIPTGSFYCPWWVFQFTLVFMFLIGLITGAIGWKKLSYQIMWFWAQQRAKI